MLHYRVIQSEKENWVVFIHPLGGSSATFYNQVREFKSEFNLLLIDLHGHGKSNKSISGLSNEEIGQDILSVLDIVGIKSAHFVGVCLGNLIVDIIYTLDKRRVLSIVYGAAVRDIDFKNRILLKVGNLMKNLMPHDMLYNLFALIMMPKQNHKEARTLFVNESKNMKRSDFLDWYSLIMNSQDFYKTFEPQNDNVKKLYIFGSEDHLFISKAEGYVKKDCNAKLHIIDRVGHLCNVESPKEFNEQSISFIKKIDIQ